MITASRYLSNEPPLLLYPKVAQALGVNDAIVIQQINYWIQNPNVGKIVDNRHWVMNSVRQWKEDNFPFWSEDTISRTLDRLRTKDILLARNDLNSSPYNKTMWYTIDFDVLDSITADCGNRVTPDAVIESGNLPTSHTETTTETTTITDPDGSDNKLVAPVKRNRPNPAALSHLNEINLPITNEREKSKSEPLTGLETYLEGIHGRSIAGFSKYRARLKEMVGTEKSPHDLWESDPAFRKWVEDRCEFYRSKRETNITFLINLICKYDGQYGWLLAQQKQAPVTDEHVWGSEPLDAKTQAAYEEILRKQNESNT